MSRRLRLALSAAVLSICFGPLATRSPARAEPAAKAPTPAVAPAQVVQAALSRPELPEGVQLGVSTLVKASTKEVPERERAIAEIARTVYDYFLLSGEGR